MRTLLVFPPAADPAHPPLGIASLAGYLRSRGDDVDLLDLNVLAYHRLLSGDHLERCAGRIETRLAELEAAPGLGADAAQEYRLLAECLLSADHLREHVGDALDDLRRKATYDSRGRYAGASALVRRAMELVSAAHYPLRWYPRGFSMSWLPTRSRDVLEATRDRRQNLFLPLIDDGLAEAAGGSPPDVVGVSINYYCQVIPGMSVAAAVRRLFPHSRVVVGGGLLCFFDGRWRDLAPFRSLVDFWVPWEGEVPLGELLAGLGRGDEAAADTPGVLRFDGDEAILSRPPPPPDPRRLPPPSFDGLPLDAYLAPELVLPLLASRGCYWKRCAFCSHHQLFRGGFRMKTAQQVRDEMDHLARRHGCRTFYLSDEAIPPRIARDLADPVAASPDGRPAYRWFGESRFERALDAATLRALAAGGCGMLMFGLESAVPRLLARMDKGIDPAWAERVLRNCHALGIRSFVMFFIGFPGETRAEAEETLRFVESLAGPVTHVAFSNFILEHRSPVYRRPGDFGIAEIVPFAGEDLKIYSAYRVEEGLSSEEAVAFLEAARERPGIRRLVELYLVSRTHLLFLPPLPEAEERTAAERTAAQLPVAGTAAGEEGPTVAGGVADEHLFPLRDPDLVPCTLAFNLEEIRTGLSAPSATTVQGAPAEAPLVPRRPTHYVFSPLREKLVEVGDDGLRLLAPCDGRFSLGEILAAVGGADRDAARGFYHQLADRGMLRWEVRA